MAVPGDAEPLMHRALKIGDGPEFPGRGCCGWPEELTGRIVVQAGVHLLPLRGSQCGAVAAHTAIDQSGHALVLVQAAPVQQTGPAAARNLADVRDRVPLAVQPYGLIARTRSPIFGAQIRLP